MKLSGVFVAAVTPVNTRGRIDFGKFDRLLDFFLAQKVDGLCIGGATSEYPHFDLTERKELIRFAAQKASGRLTLLAAVGGSRLHRVLELGETAAQEGCRALLLPMPHFFRYEQSELETFCREASRSLPLPCLLYNLPCFTNPLEVETSTRLLRDEPNLVGIKDSSGNPEALAPLKKVAEEREITLLIGSDELLLKALRAGWDGVISGGANLLPELIAQEYHSFRAGDLAFARYCHRLLEDVGARIKDWPVPWGVRIGLEARGYPTGPLPIPLSPAREQQRLDFQKWLLGWLDERLSDILQVQQRVSKQL